jgi:hypothetical protein
MENLEKKNIFKEPEGYFDGLPDRIMDRHSEEKTRSIYRISFAAAAIILLSFALFVFRTETVEPNQMQTNLEEEVNLYINAGHWNVEDILYLSENPDGLLDEIIVAEWSEYQSEDDGQLEEDLWF